LKEILPQVNASTRTLQARFEVDNRSGKLIPGLLLRTAGRRRSSLAPSPAFRSRHPYRHPCIGHRPQGVWQLRASGNQTGEDLGDQLEVLQGLREGEE
jgi:Cu(I)/Ag(I) efflux system membrane fusion protein